MSDRSGPSAQERRRRRERVFGEVLPDLTRDERSEQDGAGSAEAAVAREGSEAEAADRWLREQVPPHHG